MVDNPAPLGQGAEASGARGPAQQLRPAPVAPDAREDRGLATHALVENLSGALARFRVGADEKGQLLGVLAPTKGDLVQKR